MSDYPLIKKLGLDYEETCYPDFGVKLERLLQNATVVYSKYQNITSSWDMNGYANANTHKALLLAIEPIEQKKVTITRADLEKIVARGIREKVEADDVLGFLAKELGL